MKGISILLVAVLTALAGCGEDDDSDASRRSPRGGEEPAQTAPNSRSAARKGTTITLGGSEFGTMLFDSRKQAIYIFERDRSRRTTCYGDCAEAWPPVFTEGEPRAGAGVRQALLGTLERRDGKRQVTYAGRPLYFYAHEQAGEVRCHNVDLNGGLWWVVGPDGKRRR